MGPAFALEIDKTEPPWDQLLYWNKSWSHGGSVLSISNTKAGPMEVQFCLFPIQKLVPWNVLSYFQYKSWSHGGSVLSISYAKAGPISFCIGNRQN
jgi:hypothetical protein